MAQILDDVTELSPKLLEGIRPLKENEVAIFKLKNAGIFDKSRDVPSCPQWVQFPGVRQVVDPYVKDPNSDGFIRKTKKIGTFIKDYRNMAAGAQARPVYQDLEFKKGELRLTAADEALYRFAMRDTYNGSNKFRKQMGAKTEPKYEQTGSKEATPFMQLADMRFEAEKIVRTSPFKFLREMAAKMNTSPDGRMHVKSFLEGFTNDPEKVKYEMIQLAHTFPKQVLASHPDPKTKLRVSIYDAQVYAILTLEKGAYQLDAGDKFVEMHKPNEDQDKIDSLIEYFMSDEGKQNYLLFAKTLKKALNVG